MRVEWLEKALKNLEDEASYIALENPKAADDFSDAIFASVDKLANFQPWAVKVESKTRANGRCLTGPISSPIGYAVIAFKSSGCFTHGNVLVPSGEGA
jgi:plasmid stabilization system protein ParE